MDENIEIEISETNRGKEQLIINRKYKYNFSRKLKNSKVYRCSEYKTLNNCKSLIKINDNNVITELKVNIIISKKSLKHLYQSQNIKLMKKSEKVQFLWI